MTRELTEELDSKAADSLADSVRLRPVADVRGGCGWSKVGLDEATKDPGGTRWSTR